MVDCCVASCEGEFDPTTATKVTVTSKTIADYILYSIALAVIEGKGATLGQEGAVERDRFVI
jgi:hypothetical protein